MYSEVLEITLRSIWISGTATVIASTWSIVLAYVMSKKDSLARYLVPLSEALIGVPTVLIGLILYILLSSRGPLGLFKLLYTPQAIIIGESILVTPLMVSICYRVIHSKWLVYGELALSLGATEKQTISIVLRESIPGIIAAYAMSFSRAIGELGIALMVGGNIRGLTRVLSTAIALEVSKGEFEKAVTLGIILIVIVVAVSFGLRILKRIEKT